MTAHAPQGLEDQVTLLGEEGAQFGRGAGHPAGRAAVGKFQGEELFVGVAQGLGGVDHQGAGSGGAVPGPVEDVRGIEEFAVDGRVLAHEDEVQLVQGPLLFAQEPVPVGGIILDPQFSHPAPGARATQGDVVQGQVQEAPAPTLGSQQHGEAAVFGDLDGPNRVHDHADFTVHGSTLRDTCSEFKEAKWVLHSSASSTIESLRSHDGEGNVRSICRQQCLLVRSAGIGCPYLVEPAA